MNGLPARVRRVCPSRHRDGDGAMSTRDNATQQPTSAELREAVYEVQRYFSDELAPMMVADSVTMLLACPPALTVNAIKGWITTQLGRTGQSATAGDYLFHALKKLHQMLEYELVDREQMLRFLRATGQLVLAACPEEEREQLKQNLVRLGEAENAAAVVAQVGILHRQPGTAPAGGGPGGSSAGAAPAAGESVSKDVAQGLRRLTLMLERLGQFSGSAGAPGPVSDDLRAYALATAAVNARDGAEFSSYFERLKAMGVDPRMDQIFRALGHSLPGWDLSPAAGQDDKGQAAPDGPVARAMRRIVSMADDTSESVQRVMHMIQVAVEQFNDGSLARAGKMFRLVEQSFKDVKLDGEVAAGLQRRAQESLSSERLKEYAERPERHRLLKVVLDFFPAFRVPALYESLAAEERRDQRRVLLSLLEVHGEQTRRGALERLEACFNGTIDDPFGYLQRNLIFLLRRIPAAEGDTRELEIDYAVELSAAHYPGLLVREALGALSQIKHPKAEEGLIQRLEQFEAALDEQPEGARGEDLRGYLDRTTTALARQGTPAALRAVFKHAFKRKPIYGQTLARLEELGSRDLSIDGELVESLVKALRREVPIKLLGFVMAKNKETLLHLVRALAGTPLPAVRETLEQIAASFADQDFGVEAKAILNSFEAMKLPTRKRESQPAISGDLELFALPNLLQSLADSSSTGSLTLRDRSEQVIATIALQGGSIQACTHGALSGEVAFYQMFEIPLPGTFVFETPEAGASEPAEPPLFDVQSGLLEALRRYDEFQLARALAPDDGVFKPTGKKPTAMEGESDVAFLRELWGRATSGIPPLECERALAVDSYRVRRLFAHWLETGVLAPAAPAAARQPDPAIA